MKKAIFILVVVALQVFYYLSISGVIETNVFGSFWMKMLVTAPVWFVGYTIMDSCVKHIRKWHYNIAYLLVLASGISMYLNLANVYLGPYTYVVIFMTIMPLSYGVYIYCDGLKESDSWHFVDKIDFDQSLIVDKPDGIEDIEAVVGRSYIGAYNLQEKNKIYSTEILKYAQGEFGTLKRYILAETTAQNICAIIEHPTEQSDMGEELPLEMERPHIYCDGSENAILVYNSEKTFGLDYMNKDIYKRVNDLSSILVIEVKLDFDKSRLVRSFYAPITKIEVPVIVEKTLPIFEPIKPQAEYVPAFIDCTREEMLAELPRSAKLSDEKLFEIKEQLVDGLHELNVEVERVKMEIGERSLTCQLRYDTIPPAIRASGFPCNINIFYRLLSIDRDEKIMTIDIPYKKQVA